MNDAECYICGLPVPGAKKGLFAARIISDRWASKEQLALRPVTVPRLDH